MNAKSNPKPHAILATWLPALMLLGLSSWLCLAINNKEAIMNETGLSVVAQNDFFSVGDEQAGETDICPTTNLAKRMISLGVVPADLPEKTLRMINRTIVARFTEHGLEPVHFKQVGVGWYIKVDDYYSKRTYYVARFDKMKDDGTPRSYTTLNKSEYTQPGITITDGDTSDVWARHTIARYVAEGNGFPRKAVKVLEKLNAIRLPIGASVMVWTPDRLTRVNPGPAPDPLLVVEFGNGLCVPLCRWID